jgi:hypothetical protein
MGERVAMYGGRLQAGVCEGEFRVHARMRVPTASDSRGHAGLAGALP